MKILIADDEEFVRYELHSLLEELTPESKITEVKNGTELLNILKSESFDIAFIDIKMPGPSGLDVLEQIDSSSQETIFIILSGYSDFSFAKRAISLGVTEYLLKPVTEKDLSPILEKVIKHRPLLSNMNKDEKTSTLIRDTEKIVHKRYREQIGVAQIADELNITPNYLSSQFKQYKNQTLTKYITNIRLNVGKEMLTLQGATVKQTSEDLGYQNSRHFAKLFREKYGLSPSEFIKECRI